MKVIDLLNKIAKGEEEPKKILWHGVVFKYDEHKKDYINNNNCSLFRHDTEIYTVTDMLNDEVEIIEEDKKIEKIEEYIHFDPYTNNGEYLKNKINELIDEVNKLKEK